MSNFPMVSRPRTFSSRAECAVLLRVSVHISGKNSREGRPHSSSPSRKAKCLLLSAEAGQPVPDHGPLDGIMAGLACGEVVLLAWDVLDDGVDGFVVIEDEAAAESMRLLADFRYGDQPVVAGESAVGSCGNAAHRGRRAHAHRNRARSR